jgi:phage shock protein A
MNTPNLRQHLLGARTASDESNQLNDHNDHNDPNDHNELNDLNEQNHHYHKEQTMAIMTRIINIFKADIHGVMDQIEDRGLLLKQHLRDMAEALNRKEARLRKRTALRSQGLKDLAGYRQQWEALDHDLTVAVRKNKDDIARMLIRKMKPLEDLSEELTRHLKASDEEMIQFKNHLQQQRLRYEQLKNRTSEYLHKTQMQQWEKDGIDPVSDDGYGARADQEIELELLKRKDERTGGIATW